MLKRVIVILLVLLLTSLSLAAVLAAVEKPVVALSATETPMSTYTATVTVTPTSTATSTRTQTPSSTATWTSTVTPTPTSTATSTATATPSNTPTPLPPTSTPVAQAAPPAAPVASNLPARNTVERVVLAHYFAWYDADKWGDCNISAGDRPAQPYGSDDPAAINRQVRQAIDAGIDGFTLHWLTPGDRTDRNFAALLAQSQGTNFRSTVVFSRHFSPGATQGNVVEALRYIMDHYSGSANFLHLAGKPVIVFTDMPRVPTAGGQTPQQAWASIRSQVDPGGNAWWIAEGLDASYLDVFDGLYVLKITHADYPDDYVKEPRWANQVRAYEQSTGKPKLWFGTVSPGWDDLRAGCHPDVRIPSAPNLRSRDDGAFYRATFDSALASNPDSLFVYSYNEWVEGTYVEASQKYGDAYLKLTREFAQRFKQK